MASFCDCSIIVIECVFLVYWVICVCNHLPIHSNRYLQIYPKELNVMQLFYICLFFGLVSEKLKLVSPTWMWHCKFFVVWCILVRFYSIDISKLYSSVCKVFSVLCILGVLSLLWIWSMLFISLINFHTSWYFIWYDYCFGCLFFFLLNIW